MHKHDYDSVIGLLPDMWENGPTCWSMFSKVKASICKSYLDSTCEDNQFAFVEHNRNLQVFIIIIVH